MIEKENNRNSDKLFLGGSIILGVLFLVILLSVNYENTEEVKPSQETTLNKEEEVKSKRARTLVDVQKNLERLLF